MANGNITIDVLLNDSQAEKGLKNVEDGAGKAGNALGLVTVAATAVVAGLVAIGTSAVKSFLDAEQASVKLQNQLGIGAERAQDLTNVARNIYNQGFGESLGDVTDALFQVRQNIGELNNEDLQRVTNQAIGLAQTFDADLNEVTRAAGNIATAYGIEASEAFDLLANGAQNGLNFSNELFDNVSEYIPLFQQYGFSAQEAFGFLQNGAQQGVYNLDYINDIVKEFGIRAQDSSTQTETAFADLGARADAAYESFKRGEITVAELSRVTGEELAKIDQDLVKNSIGVELFGTKFEDLGADVATSLFTSSTAVTNYAGSADEILTNLSDTTQARFDSVVRTVTGFITPIGGLLVTAVDDALQLVISTFETYSDSIFETATNAYNQIAPYIESIIARVSAFIGGVLSDIVSFWQENGDRITNIVSTAFGVILAVFNTVLPGLLFVVQFIWNAIVDVIEGAVLVIDGIINVFSALFSGNFTLLWESVKQIFTGGIQLIIGLLNLSFVGSIRTLLANFATASLATIRGLWTNISGSFTSSISSITGSVGSFVNAIRTFFTNLSTNLVNTVTSLATNVTNGFIKISDDVISVFTSLPSRFIQFGKDIINGLINGIRSIDVFSVVANIADGLVSTVKDKLSIFSPSRAFEGIGEDINAGWEIGLTSNSDTVLGAVNSTVDGVLQTALRGTNQLASAVSNLNPNVNGLTSGNLGSLNSGLVSSNSNNSRTQVNNITVRSTREEIEIGRQLRRQSFAF